MDGRLKVWYREDLCNYVYFGDRWLHAASLMVAASSRGREASLHSPSRLSVEKSRQRAMALLKDEMMLGG